MNNQLRPCYRKCVCEREEIGTVDKEEKKRVSQGEERKE
jgi:hypothetical protein